MRIKTCPSFGLTLLQGCCDLFTQSLFNYKTEVNGHDYANSNLCLKLSIATILTFIFYTLDESINILPKLIAMRFHCF